MSDRVRPVVLQRDCISAGVRGAQPRRASLSRGWLVVVLEDILEAINLEPVVRAAVQGLRGQRVSLIIDRLLLRHGQNVLVVSAAFRRRSIPLAWRILPHTGSRGLADQQQILTTAMALLPEQVRVTVVHGNSEFRNQALYQWLREHDGDAMLGIQGGTLIAHTPPPPPNC